MPRINGEDVEMLVLDVVRQESQDGQSPIKLARLYEALRAKYWDLDDSDIRSAMGKLFASKRVLLTVDRQIRLLDHAANIRSH